MLSRRELLGAGFAGAAPIGSAETEKQIRRTHNICDLPLCPEVETIRALQRTFLKGHQKFPDFVEVGIEVWDRVYDWHLRTWQPVTVTQRPDEPYAMAFSMTTLILRPDVEEGFVGFPYDAGA